MLSLIRSETYCNKFIYIHKYSIVGLRMNDDVVRVSTPPLSPVWEGSRPPWTTWPQLQNEPGRQLQHAVINELIRRPLTSAKVPLHLEPLGTSCVDEKRPGGATVMPWKCGRVLTRDIYATCPDTYTPSHLALAARESGAVANQAEQWKSEKYAHLRASHHFVSFAIETWGCLDLALSPLEDIGRRIRAETVTVLPVPPPRSFGRHPERERCSGIGHGTRDWQCIYLIPDLLCLLWRLHRFSIMLVKFY